MYLYTIEAIQHCGTMVCIEVGCIRFEIMDEAGLTHLPANGSEGGQLETSVSHQAHGLDDSLERIQWMPYG